MSNRLDLLALILTCLWSAVWTPHCQYQRVGYWSLWLWITVSHILSRPISGISSFTKKPVKQLSWYWLVLAQFTVARELSSPRQSSLSSGQYQHYTCNWETYTGSHHQVPASKLTIIAASHWFSSQSVTVSDQRFTEEVTKYRQRWGSWEFSSWHWQGQFSGAE